MGQLLLVSIFIIVVMWNMVLMGRLIAVMNIYETGVA